MLAPPLFAGGTMHTIDSIYVNGAFVTPQGREVPILINRGGK
jgi:hypothetical protein